MMSAAEILSDSRLDLMIKSLSSWSEMKGAYICDVEREIRADVSCCVQNLIAFVDSLDIG